MILRAQREPELDALLLTTPVRDAQEQLRLIPAPYLKTALLPVPAYSAGGRRAL